MPIDRADIEAALEKKGFVLADGDHNFFTYYSKDGQKTSVWTKTSHGSKYKTLGDSLVSAMAQQCRLTTPEFKKFVACPLTRDEYEGLLIERGHFKVTGD
jgi:hypothetical protein